MAVSTGRWDNVVNNVGRGVKMRNKLIENRSHNWLLAMYFLASAKSVAGKHLSDAERNLINSLRSSPNSDSIISALAHSYGATSSDLRRQIFPDHFASLSIDDAVSFADLAQVAPNIVARVLEHLNVPNLEMPAIHLNPAAVDEPVHAQVQAPQPPMQAPALHFNALRSRLRRTASAVWMNRMSGAHMTRSIGCSVHWLRTTK